MTQPMSIPSKRLAASITATATSIRINNINDWSGTAMTATSFASVTSFPVVLRNDANTQIEFVEANMATLSTSVYTVDITKRGLSYVGGTTANESTSYSWNTNDIVELGSNPPQLYEQYVDKDNAETIAGVKTFSSFPAKSGTTTPTSSSEFATKAYVDATASSSLNYLANIISDVAGAAISLGQVLYFSSSNQYWYQADADLSTSFTDRTLGVAVSSGSSGASINIMLAGVSSSVSTSMTAGQKQYLSNTAGALSSDAGTNEVYLGYALSSTDFLFEQRRDDMPSAGEKNALAGLVITTSAPSASNPYLTAYDSTSAVTTSGALVVRRNATGDVLVNETPQTTSAAASKAYVDTMGDAVNYNVNSIRSSSQTKYTFELTPPHSTSIGGWTLNNMTSSNISNRLGENLYQPAATGWWALQASLLVGTNSSDGGTTEPANSMGPIRLKQIYRSYRRPSTAAELFGFGLVTSVSSSNLTTSPAAGAGMMFLLTTSSSSISAMTWSSDGGDPTLNTSTSVTEATFWQRNLYEIEYTPSSSVLFSINGNVIATHTTDLLSTGNTSNVSYVSQAFSTNTNQGMIISPVTISYEI